MMLVRPSEPRDYYAIADILDAMDHDEAWDYQWAAEGGSQPSFPSWVVVEGERVVGMIEGRFDIVCGEPFEQVDHPPPHAWVFLLGVRAQARRRGVGRALLRCFAGHAVQAGCSFIALRPDQRDDGVLGRVAFFRACGLLPLVADAPDD